MRALKSRHAFTLVELLVVISIIALLMAILLPTLRRARDQAKQTACASNLRQVGVALGMYADGHNDWMPTWSMWHRWGYYGTEFDGQDGDGEGPAWTEWLRFDGSLPGIDIYRCPAFPDRVNVTYFLSAYALWTREELSGTRRGVIRYPAEYVLSGDCTNPQFYAPPFGTNMPLNFDDADMDDATQPALDWDRPIHGKQRNNVLFADTHVNAYTKFNPGQMTHDTRERGIDWGQIELEDDTNSNGL